MFKAMDESSIISRMWRIGRSIKGLTQKEIAHSLQISQATVSQIEKNQAEPSAVQWFMFCQLVGIDAHKTLELGYIDGHERFYLSSYPENLFKIPVKYKKNANLKVREIMALASYLYETQGEDSWKNFITIHELDEDIFFVHDLEVSLKLFEDILNYMARFGVKASRYISNDDLPPRKTIASLNARDLVIKWIDIQRHYQMVFKPSLADVENSFKLEFQYTNSAQSIFGEEVVQNFIKYKISKLEYSLQSYMGSRSKFFDISYRPNQVALYFSKEENLS